MNDRHEQFVTRFWVAVIYEYCCEFQGWESCRFAGPDGPLPMTGALLVQAVKIEGVPASRLRGVGGRIYIRRVMMVHGRSREAALLRLHSLVTRFRRRYKVISLEPRQAYFRRPWVRVWDEDGGEARWQRVKSASAARPSSDIMEELAT